MPESDARATMVCRLIEAAERDPRIVSLIDYGSSSEGRVDEWSDVDVAMFIRDADLDSFEREWKSWAAQFGDLLLAYISGTGHPWTVYDARPVPLRVDFVFHPESERDAMLDWSNSPSSAEAMVLYDGTGDQFITRAQRLVGKSLRPPDLAQAFELNGGEFWYYVLRTLCKFERGHWWAARHDFNWIVMYHLFCLLRLEAGAVEHWQGMSAAVGIERAISAMRLSQLDACIPEASAASLKQSLFTASQLGREVCQTIAATHGWSWPERLAARILEFFTLDRTLTDTLI